MKWYERVYFYFDGCDATLNFFEFIGAVITAAAICAAPFVLKWILLMIL